MMRTYPALLIASLIVLTLAGCENRTERTQPPESTADQASLAPATQLATQAEGPILRAYEVPREHAEQIAGTLNHLLRSQQGEPPIGEITLSPDGRILVIAPPGVHSGVEDFLAAMGPLEPHTVEQMSVELTYWLVVGRPAEEASDYAAFGEVAPALEEIANSQGPLEFELRERLSLVSVDSEEAAVDGRYAHIRQFVSRAQEGHVTRLEIESFPYQIRTTVHLRLGQFVVLGQVGYQSEPDAAPTSMPTTEAAPVDGTLFYIVRASGEE